MSTRTFCMYIVMSCYMKWSTSEVGEKDVVHVPCGSTNVNTLQAQKHTFFLHASHFHVCCMCVRCVGLSQPPARVPYP